MWSIAIKSNTSKFSFLEFLYHIFFFVLKLYLFGFSLWLLVWLCQPPFSLHIVNGMLGQNGSDTITLLLLVFENVAIISLEYLKIKCYGSDSLLYFAPLPSLHHFSLSLSLSALQMGANYF